MPRYALLSSRTARHARKSGAAFPAATDEPACRDESAATEPASDGIYRQVCSAGKRCAFSRVELVVAHARNCPARRSPTPAHGRVTHRLAPGCGDRASGKDHVARGAPPTRSTAGTVRYGQNGEIFSSQIAYARPSLR